MGCKVVLAFDQNHTFVSSRAYLLQIFFSQRAVLAGIRTHTIKFVKIILSGFQT